MGKSDVVDFVGIILMGSVVTGLADCWAADERDWTRIRRR